MIFSSISYLEFDGIHSWDSPDYSDAFICYAEWSNGTALTEEELDVLNEDSQYVYEKLMEHLY